MGSDRADRESRQRIARELHAAGYSLSTIAAHLQLRGWGTSRNGVRGLLDPDRHAAYQRDYRQRRAANEGQPLGRDARSR